VVPPPPEIVELFVVVVGVTVVEVDALPTPAS
jgi:hypothetical protein